MKDRITITSPTAQYPVLGVFADILDADMNAKDSLKLLSPLIPRLAALDAEDGQVNVNRAVAMFRGVLSGILPQVFSDDGSPQALQVKARLEILTDARFGEIYATVRGLAQEPHRIGVNALNALQWAERAALTLGVAVVNGTTPMRNTVHAIYDAGTRYQASGYRRAQARRKMVALLGQVAETKPSNAHPFEDAGLGDAPYMVEQVIIHDGPTGYPQGECAYCARPARTTCQMRSEESHRFEVCVECVRKNHADPHAGDRILNLYQKAKARAVNL